MVLGAATLLASAWIFWPMRLFTAPCSVVVEDRNGELLSARIASDGQWRFPAIRKVPSRFSQAIIASEDRWFRFHPGFDPAALVRALHADIRAWKPVSGGSTITMQVVRLSRSNPPRTVPEKCLEILLSFKLTLRYSKDKVLALYASHAPFGGNVVGLEAAAWRYFGRPPEDLSWAESATLAVLPNEPALVHPGRNRTRLLDKRNKLLARLCKLRILDSIQMKLAVAEPLVPDIRPLPDNAPHLLDRIVRETASAPEGLRMQTTLSSALQRQVVEVLLRHHAELAANHINNGAVLVLDVATGEALAYAGNVTNDSAVNGAAVDCITAPRSTGSVLKPLLYACMLDAGELLPTTLIPDIPTTFGGYTPQNFNREYEGAVPAAMALARSLNIPAARMAQQHGIARFYHDLQNFGMTTLSRPADDYGISIILGGVEGTLWELTGMYAAMARAVNQYHDDPLNDPRGSFTPPRYLPDDKRFLHRPRNDKSQDPVSAGACWAALQAMVEVVRPGDEGAWRDFSSSRRVAWKTGTSFGFRDGWAIGVTPRYAVGVWTGNASGEGRPGLIGIETAAPLLFDIFNLLPRNDRWFFTPENDLRKVAVCRQSGYLPGPFCEETDSVLVPQAGLRTGPCPYHQVVHLDNTGMWRVSSSCEQVSTMRHCSWFVLPPAIEAYYRIRHGDYRVLPSMRGDCAGADQQAAMGLIYPHGDGQIYIPRELDGTKGKAVLRASHREARATVHWHLDGQYLGSTTTIHEMAVSMPAGNHRLVLVDDRGNMLEKTVVVIDK